MKLTEKEYLINNEQLVFRLRNLILNDSNTFHQIKEFLPFPMYINSRDSNEYQYFSKNFFSKGKEIEDLYKIGGHFLDSISNPFLLNIARKKAKQFSKRDDYNGLCSYLQIIQLNGKQTPFFTNKILINNELTLNTSLFTNEFPILDNIIKDFIPKDLQNGVQWKLFSTLTKQEKKIVKLLVEGFDNELISETLCISKYTVVTHRKNIYRKLDINNISQLVKFALVMEIL